MAASRCILRHYERGPFQNNVYLLEDAELRHAWVVDPSMDSDVVLEEIERRRLDLKVILNTHAHLDHVFHNRLFRERTGAEIWIHADDLPLLEAVEQQGRMFGIEVSASPPPDRLLRHGDRLRFAGLEFEVLHTPGHTPGGICLHSEGLLVAGDTLFAGSIGRTDLPGGSYATLIRSIRDCLLPLPDATRVLSGHGPETTIGRERGSNPFILQPETFGSLG
jgi:glyoxylase-like metal-dependent hydrolase (beta-lactamase superfamily II)